MNRRSAAWWIGGVSLVWLVFFTAVQWSGFQHAILVRVINRVAEPFVSGPVRVASASIGRDLKLRFRGIEGNYRARQGPVALGIERIEAQGPRCCFLGPRPVRFVFDGAKPKASPRDGFSGTLSVSAGKAWRVEAAVDFEGADLEDLRWLDPQNLDGASGALGGSLRCVQTAGHDPVLDLKIAVAQPGGQLQAKFFDLFLPYLPTSAQKERVKMIVAGKQTLVRYRTAALNMNLPRPDLVKILLRILVLDYNLLLNLDVTVRLDQKDALLQIAHLLGFIQAKGP
ncbi:MAG: hypothetical protein KTQ49_06320 [Candidatus Omnitrophica bacterium]|nr:hypothetical protein [Candidatus Omnitrophota bacterium]